MEHIFQACNLYAIRGNFIKEYSVFFRRKYITVFRTSHDNTKITFFCKASFSFFRDFKQLINSFSMNFRAKKHL